MMIPILRPHVRTINKQKSDDNTCFILGTYIIYIMINGNNNGDNNYILLLPVVDDSPPSGGLAELDPVLITNLVRVLWLLLDRTIKKKKIKLKVHCRGPL